MNKSALIAFFLIVLISLPASAEFRVGASMQVITPDPLLPISGGMGPTAPATQKQGELTARAVVFEQGSERFERELPELAFEFPQNFGRRVAYFGIRIGQGSD